MPYKLTRGLLAAVALTLALWNPINDTFNRVLLLAGILGLWVTVMETLWKQDALRLIWISLPITAAILFMLPGQAAVGDLQLRYIEQLRTFKNVPYHWGGESRRGIDCSGLPRRALRQAMRHEGLANGDGSLLRLAFQHWWQDASAQNLSVGIRELTIPLGVTGKISGLDTSTLLPGDLAVTRNGIHLIVYLGDNLWIQADPSQGKVAIEHAQQDLNPWFDNQVSMHRWRCLQP